MKGRSAFILCAVSTGCAHEQWEKLQYDQHIAVSTFQKYGWEVVYEVIVANPNHQHTFNQQRRRSRLLSATQKGSFECVIFGGDIALPYLCAVRRAAYPHTRVLSAAVTHSQLDFFLQMFEFERT